VRIKYQSRFGIATKELRDITGGHEYASWNNGDERDIPEDATLMAREPTGKIVRKNAIQALLEFGPDFVDVATGKNPLYVCSRCGDDVFEMHFIDRATMKNMWLTEDGTENSKRLCLADWLSDHLDYITQANKYGWPPETIAKAQEVRGARNSNGNGDEAKSKKVRPTQNETAFATIGIGPEIKQPGVVAEGA
jgi:hypothetical protein